MTEKEDPRIANLTRAVMEDIRSATPHARLAEVPTLFAFGPIYRAIYDAEQRAAAAPAAAQSPMTDARLAQADADWTRVSDELDRTFAINDTLRAEIARLDAAVNQGNALLDAALIAKRELTAEVARLTRDRDEARAALDAVFTKVDE